MLKDKLDVHVPIQSSLSFSPTESPSVLRCSQDQMLLTPEEPAWILLSLGRPPHLSRWLTVSLYSVSPAPPRVVYSSVSQITACLALPFIKGRAIVGEERSNLLHFRIQWWGQNGVERLEIIQCQTIKKLFVEKKDGSWEKVISDHKHFHHYFQQGDFISHSLPSSRTRSTTTGEFEMRPAFCA